MSAAAKKPPAKRSYRSPLREEQARATRRRIVEAAYRLFLTDGYPHTSMAGVAAAAGVAVDTVYHLFGSKRGLMKEVMDVAIGGDDADVKVLDRPEKQAVRDEPNRRRQLAMFAEGMADQLERIAPAWAMLEAAAAVDPELAELRDDLQLRQRRASARMLVDWFAARTPLREGLSRDDAAAIIWTITSSEVHHMFRSVWGWSLDRYRQWLEDTMARTVIGPLRPAPQPPR